jgi:hypothetical protein
LLIPMRESNSYKNLGQNEQLFQLGRRLGYVSNQQRPISERNISISLMSAFEKQVFTKKYIPESDCEALTRKYKNEYLPLIKKTDSRRTALKGRKIYSRKMRNELFEDLLGSSRTTAGLLNSFEDIVAWGTTQTLPLIEHNKHGQAARNSLFISLRIAEDHKAFGLTPREGVNAALTILNFGFFSAIEAEDIDIASLCISQIDVICAFDNIRIYEDLERQQLAFLMYGSILRHAEDIERKANKWKWRLGGNSEKAMSMLHHCFGKFDEVSIKNFCRNEAAELSRTSGAFCQMVRLTGASRNQRIERGALLALEAEGTYLNDGVSLRRQVGLMLGLAFYYLNEETLGDRSLEGAEMYIKEALAVMLKAEDLNIFRWIDWYSCCAKYLQCVGNSIASTLALGWIKQLYEKIDFDDKAHKVDKEIAILAIRRDFQPRIYQGSDAADLVSFITKTPIALKLLTK